MELSKTNKSFRFKKINPYLVNFETYRHSIEYYSLDDTNSCDTYIIRITKYNKNYDFKITLDNNTTREIKDKICFMSESTEDDSIIPVIIYPLLIGITSSEKYLTFFHYIDTISQYTCDLSDISVDPESKRTLINVTKDLNEKEFKSSIYDKLLDKKFLWCTFLVREKNVTISLQLEYDPVSTLASIGEIKIAGVTSYKKGTRKKKEII